MELHTIGIPAQYVKLYVKTNKNDYIDAKSLAEARGDRGCAFTDQDR